MKTLKELVEIQKTIGGVITPAIKCTASLRIKAITEGYYAEDTDGSEHVLLTPNGQLPVKSTHIKDIPMLTCMFCGQVMRPFP